MHEAMWLAPFAALDDTRTPDDARVYWGERVKSFDRVYAAVAPRAPPECSAHEAPRRRAAGGSQRAPFMYLQNVLKMLDEKVGG